VIRNTGQRCSPFLWVNSHEPGSSHPSTQVICNRAIAVTLSRSASSMRGIPTGLRMVSELLSLNRVDTADGTSVTRKSAVDYERRNRHESSARSQRARSLSFCAEDPLSCNRLASSGFAGSPPVDGYCFGAVSTLGSPQAGERACMTRFLLAKPSDCSDQFGVADDLRPRTATASSTRRRTLSKLRGRTTNQNQEPYES
jgi:hypothetical protein